MACNNFQNFTPLSLFYFIFKSVHRAQGRSHLLERATHSSDRQSML